MPKRRLARRPRSHSRAACSAAIVSTIFVAGAIGCASQDTSASQDSRDAHAERPNVVVIFIDDLAYADIGSFGAKDYATPHLDRMAREGRRFTDFYVSQAVCSASRASLLTGCYSNRVGILGALGPKARHGLSSEETTLAEVCKERGYATACYGKWHLGHHRAFLPMQHSFDDYFGLPYSNDMWPYHPGVRHLPMAQRIKRWPHLPLIDKNEIIEPRVTPEIQKTLTGEYTRRAVDFIRANRKRPFFLYLPHSMVHVPLFASKDFEGKTGKGLFADVMAEVDASVGSILETLRELELDKNTLVGFTSDNGPWLSYGDHAGSAAPLREGKGTMFGGGCRVPTIFWWPGKIPAGTSCATPAMTIDLLPTIAACIGSRAKTKKIDGKDIWPLIAGSSDESPQQAYYFYYGRQLQALRMGKWKLHFPHRYRTLDGRPGGTGGIPTRYTNKTTGVELYDLEHDIGETRDVANEHPELVARLRALGDAMRQELGDSKLRGSGQRQAGRLH